MRGIMAGALFVLVISAQTAPAGEIREIELNDGSVITGELLSLSGGMYTIKSDSLGIVRVEETKIRAVRSKTPASSGLQSNGSASVQAGALTDRMMNDAEIMSMIRGLQDDPDFKKILEDPEIMQAVKNNDVATLMSKPEFMRLLDNPPVRTIREKVKQGP
jgi:hypothetical protein